VGGGVIFDIGRSWRRSARHYVGMRASQTLCHHRWCEEAPRAGACLWAQRRCLVGKRNALEAGDEVCGNRLANRACAAVSQVCATSHRLKARQQQRSDSNSLSHSF
jgi:hypothetical protein